MIIEPNTQSQILLNKKNLVKFKPQVRCNAKKLIFSFNVEYLNHQ